MMLYVYIDKGHPKRGGRYGQHFHFTGHRFQSVRGVVWHTDGKKGYVREGEYVRIDKFQPDGSPAARRFRRKLDDDKEKWRVAGAALLERGRVREEWIKGEPERKRNEKVEPFRLEYTT